VSSAAALPQLVDLLVVNAENDLGGKQLQQFLIADRDVTELDFSRARELDHLRVVVFLERCNDPQVRLGAAGRAAHLIDNLARHNSGGTHPGAASHELTGERVGTVRKSVAVVGAVNPRPSRRSRESLFVECSTSRADSEVAQLISVEVDPLPPVMSSPETPKLRCRPIQPHTAMSTRQLRVSRRRNGDSG
jgi:hypothetical protein